MADDPNISYSHQTGSTAAPAQPASAPAANATLYAFADCDRVSIPNGGVLLIHKDSDRQMIVAHEVAIALQSCNAFRTLQEHVEVLTTTIPQLDGQQANVTQVLDMVKDAGLLTTAEEVCQRISNPDEAASPSPAPTRVFVITCDRPAAVQRLLQSMQMGGNLVRHEQLFLIDDSRDPENAELNRQVVEQFNLRSPKDMQYVGATQQKLLLDALVKELPEQEPGIRFLIDRDRWATQKSYGLARTLCLLLSVDNRAIVMDDDVICAAVASPFKQSGVAFGDTGREVEFYSSEQDILTRTTKTDFDPLTGHAQCLGLTMSQAVNKLGTAELQGQDLKSASATYMSQWHADTPILVTQSGTMGDPGTPKTDWVYTVDPASAARLMASPDGLDGALTNRHYWMGQPRPIFSKMAVISQVTGLDNSHMLPPYFPVFRGEDYLFGAMVEYLHPQSAVLEYDWCVPHFPMETRSGSADNEPSTGKGGINPSKFITDRTHYETGISAETRLTGLAQMLKELSETSNMGLLARYRIEVAEAQSAQTQRLTQKLQDGTPRTQEWQNHLQQSLNNIAEAMNSTARLEDIPGMPDTHQAQAILDDFRAYSGEFAIALAAWPAIRKAAKSISDELINTEQLAP